MVLEGILKIIMVILSILLIIVVILQPTQKTGLIGDATDIEKREKRGFHLFLFRATIILAILFIGTAITFGVAKAGLI